VTYDDFAADYDQHFRREVDRWEDEWLAELLRPHVDGRHVIDLGCGTGWVADHLEPARYTGIDRSGPMLAELGRKHPEAVTAKAEIGSETWTTALPAGLDRWEAATATWSLEYLGELPDLLWALTVLVEPGGVLALHGSLPRGHRRQHFSVKPPVYRPLGPHQVRAASRSVGLAAPECRGTSMLPDEWAALGRGWWRRALAAPAGMHYSALWTWQL
jgi:predicted TPR repeat methyltransferase